MKLLNILKIVTVQAVLFVLALVGGSTEASANPSFFSTSDPSYWKVATNVGGTDGAYSSFPSTGFTDAYAVSGRTDWIANKASGSNGTWTFFVFRQTFDLTGYDYLSTNLQFQWAADDSGEVAAARGSWKPKYRLNSGLLTDGVWAPVFGATYSYGPTATLNSGFVAGTNTIDFYVEGNGTTDGFALRTMGFTADKVTVTPEPAAMLLMGSGLFGMFFRRRFVA